MYTIHIDCPERLFVLRLIARTTYPVHADASECVLDVCDVVVLFKAEMAHLENGSDKMRADLRRDVIGREKSLCHGLRLKIRYYTQCPSVANISAPFFCFFIIIIIKYFARKCYNICRRPAEGFLNVM